MTKGLPEQIKQGTIDRAPVGQLGQPTDVAYAYQFQASDEAGFINSGVILGA